MIDEDIFSSRHKKPRKLWKVVDSFIVAYMVGARSVNGNGEKLIFKPKIRLLGIVV